VRQTWAGLGTYPDRPHLLINTLLKSRLNGKIVKKLSENSLGLVL
jgi:hypothetical protein